MRLKLLERQIKVGSLHLHMPGGGVHSFGQGEPSAHMIIHRPAALLRILRWPEMAFGECYMDGDWEPGEGGMLRVCEVLFRNYRNLQGRGFLVWLGKLQGLLLENNSADRSRRNVQHHYDLDESLFRRFLDADMHYSCAYFEHPGMTLETAQQAKCRLIASKLLLKPGDEVLDIGSGWGGLALYLAEQHKVRVTGLTLSRDQFETSCRRAKERGLEDRVRFLLRDYRDHARERQAGQDRGYDAIVSVGMFEHVGRPQYQVFFDSARGMLAPGGRMLLHSIGRSGPPTSSRSWVQKYIFPGSYIPALSEMVEPVERSGLVLSDLEVLRVHYAETLRHWHARFQASRSYFAARSGERFCRMWEFYLQVCEAVFRWGDLVVFHLQLANSNGTVPLTRGYLYQPQTPLPQDKPRLQRAGGQHRN